MGILDLDSLDSSSSSIGSFVEVDSLDEGSHSSNDASSSELASLEEISVSSSPQEIERPPAARPAPGKVRSRLRRSVREPRVVQVPSFQSLCSHRMSPKRTCLAPLEGDQVVCDEHGDGVVDTGKKCEFKWKGSTRRCPNFPLIGRKVCVSHKNNVCSIHDKNRLLCVSCVALNSARQLRLEQAAASRAWRARTVKEELSV